MQNKEMHTNSEQEVPAIGDPTVKPVLNASYTHLVRGLHHLNIILIHSTHPVNSS